VPGLTEWQRWRRGKCGGCGQLHRRRGSRLGPAGEWTSASARMAPAEVPFPLPGLLDCNSSFVLTFHGDQLSPLKGGEASSCWTVICNLLGMYCAGSTDYYYRLQGGGTFRSITAAIKHLLAAEHGAASPAAAHPQNQAAASDEKPQPLQQERPLSATPRPASPARAAAGSSELPETGSPPGEGGPAGPDAKLTPKKFGSLTALSQPRGSSAVARPTSPSDSVAKGKQAAEGTPSAAAAPRPGTKAALAALGRDTKALGPAHDSKKATQAEAQADGAEGIPKSGQPGSDGSAPDDEVAAAAEGNAAAQEEATHNEPSARRRRRSEWLSWLASYAAKRQRTASSRGL
jgi:hypothetical protein